MPGSYSVFLCCIIVEKQQIVCDGRDSTFLGLLADLWGVTPRKSAIWMVVISQNLFSHILWDRFCLEYWLSLSTMSCFIVESSSTSAALGWRWFPRTSCPIRNKRNKRNSFRLAFSAVSFCPFIHSFKCFFNC